MHIWPKMILLHGWEYDAVMLRQEVVRNDKKQTSPDHVHIILVPSTCGYLNDNAFEASTVDLNANEYMGIKLYDSQILLVTLVINLIVW